jgi:hypothetical protein
LRSHLVDQRRKVNCNVRAGKNLRPAGILRNVADRLHVNAGEICARLPTANNSGDGVILANQMPAESGSHEPVRACNQNPH